MIDPAGMDVTDWADAMVPVLSRFGPVGRIEDPAFWQVWATLACELPTVRSHNPPNPFEFEDWTLWAQRFIQIPVTWG